jgi:hypothetical protein
MSNKRPRLTVAVEQLIVSYIRAGGFAHVAAEAAGIPHEVFDAWLRQGENPRGHKKYRAFRVAVLKAQAQARLGAEVTVLKDKPLDWLRYGPGRQTEESAGWTGTVRPPPAGAGQKGAQALHEVQELCKTVLELLAPYPEARAALAAALSERGEEETSE